MQFGAASWLAAERYAAVAKASHMGVLKHLPDMIADPSRIKIADRDARRTLNDAVQTFKDQIRREAKDWLEEDHGEVKSHAHGIWRLQAVLSGLSHSVSAFRQAAQNYDKKHDVALTLAKEKQQLIESFLQDLADGKEELGPDKTRAETFFAATAQEYFNSELSDALDRAVFAHKPHIIDSDHPKTVRRFVAEAAQGSFQHALKKIIKDAEKNMSPTHSSTRMTSGLYRCPVRIAVITTRKPFPAIIFRTRNRIARGSWSCCKFKRSLVEQLCHVVPVNEAVDETLRDISAARCGSRCNRNVPTHRRRGSACGHGRPGFLRSAFS